MCIAITCISGHYNTEKIVYSKHFRLKQHLGIWGEWLFFLRELESTGDFFQGFWELLIVLGIKGALQKSKKNLTLNEKPSLRLFFF